jgi:subtilisin family serine protease
VAAHLYGAPSGSGRAASRGAGPPEGRGRRSGGTDQVSATPPTVNYWYLDVPGDVAQLLNVAPIHRAGGTGKGVRIVMIDTGFFHSHPFFPAHGYSSSVVLAPGASGRATDPGSHGTGESANIFSVAPGATFIGVKLENDDDPRRGASILEGFQEALKHQPHVVSVSMGYDLRDADGVTPLASLPGSLKALEAEFHAAVASGIVVVFSAGNGHYSFPGQMPDVISAGGVFVDADGSMRASDYASAFRSRIYSGRSVPDFCGLVGLLPHADYVMLPVPPGQEIDTENAAHDGTAPDDGWGVFSGTSAAAPQDAGVCALLLERNPGLKPADVKAILRRTSREVLVGHANPASDPNRVGETAADGADREGPRRRFRRMAAGLSRPARDASAAGVAGDRGLP